MSKRSCNAAESAASAFCEWARAELHAYFAFTSFVRNTYQSAPVRQMEE